MLAMLKQILNSPQMEKDCISFDEKDNLNGGMRIRRRLKKITNMSRAMYKDVLAKDIELKKKRRPCYVKGVEILRKKEAEKRRKLKEAKKKEQQNAKKASPKKL